MSIVNSIRSKFKIDLEGNGRCAIGEFIMTTGPFYIKCASNANIKIGSRCFFNHNVSITCVEQIKIGNNCNFANNVVIVDHDHKLSSLGVIDGLNSKPIKIGNNVWCGANVTLLKGITIGDGAVIAAGAVVNKDIPCYELWGGVPAKFIKHL